MYASIRKYYIINGMAPEFLRRVREEGFVQLVSQVPGFEAYYVLQVGDDEVISISLFDTEAGAEESVRQATVWVATHLVSLLQGFPDIMVGTVSICEPPPTRQGAGRKGTVPHDVTHGPRTSSVLLSGSS